MSVKLTHLDKIYWPGEKISKKDLIEYYAKVASTLLKYTKDRPLVMHRFPNGMKGQGFYQKDVENVPDFVKTALIAHERRKVRYIIAQNAKTLLYVANLGSIEMHLFHSRLKHLDQPDYMILDLDPESISFDAVVDTALVIHDILSELKIPHFCKTSGGTGLHIYVPTKAKYTYDELRKCAQEIGKMTAKKLPLLISMERSLEKRKRKVYIDTLRNAKGQLSVAPYSARAFPKAPVSTPLEWEEVERGLDPKDFTIQNVADRLEKKGDLFKGILRKGANLSALL